jgi:hypothetical protein
VSVILPQDVNQMSKAVYCECVEFARREIHCLPGRLAWQSLKKGGSALVLRRLLVAPRGVRKLGPARRVRRRHAYETQLESGGTVFGCTLGNLMHHARARKYRLMRAMKVCRQVLERAGNGLSTATGDDRDVLVRGLACHRVLQAQGRKLHELKHAPEIDYKMGHKGVVVGASASILIAFECMALDPEDTEGLCSQLMHTLRDAHTALASWRLPENVDMEMREAKGAEVRTLERARVGVARAQHIGEDLTHARAIRLQLDFYRRAAWPAGQHLDAVNHRQVLDAIRSGELVDHETHSNAAGALAPGVIALAALPSLQAPEDDEVQSQAVCHRWDAASCSEQSGSAGSSAWSFASSSSTTDDVMSAVSPPLFALDFMTQLENRLNASRLSVAAKGATAREVVIQSILQQHPMEPG